MIFYTQDIPADVIESMDKGAGALENMMKGTLDGLDEMFALMIPPLVDNVMQQRERLGGDWAVPLAIYSRSQRDILRKMIGGNLVIIVLNMTKECSRKRLDKRHAGTVFNMDMMDKLYKLYEPAGKNLQFR